ncbi:MAG: hypothetical protein ACR2IE_14300 [Candidatus Sumerlaeaceae bacterium]
MYSPKRLTWVLAFATLTSFAGAAEGTTFTQAWGVGEVAINDRRILDLTGQYDLVGTSHSLHLRIVQDRRGRLLTSATLTNNFDNVTTSFPMMGGIHANGKSPLVLELAGARRPPQPPPGDAVNPPPPRHGIGATIRGRLVGNHFHVFVEVRGPRGGSRFQADLTPENQARGAIVSDAPALQGPNGGLATTRTVTLPSHVYHLRGVEVRRGIADRLTIGAPPPRRTLNFNPPPPFGMDLQGAITDTDQFRRRKNIVRIGYGNLDSTSGTLVTHTTF